MMRIAMITSRPAALAALRAGLELRGFRVECIGDAWGFLRTGLDRDWCLVILDGIGAQVRPFLEYLAAAEPGLPVAVVAGPDPEAYRAAVEGLGAVCPLPARPASSDAAFLLERLRTVGALRPGEEAAQASLDTLKRQRHPHCVVCWDRHPFGLQVDYCVSGPDSVEGTFACGKSYEGYAGRLHGGVVSTLLDGAMVSCLLAKGLEAYTVDLRVRYHAPVATGRPATIRASWVKGRGPLQWLQANLEQDGKVCARARATFLLDPPGRRTCPETARPGPRTFHPRIPEQA